MMNTILILGGYGATGRLLTKHLLAETDHNIVIAGRSLEKALAFVDSLHDARVTAKRVDAADHLSLREALQQVDFLLIAAPTTHHTETIVCAALEAGEQLRERRRHVAIQIKPGKQFVQLFLRRFAFSLHGRKTKRLRLKQLVS